MRLKEEWRNGINDSTFNCKYKLQNNKQLRNMNYLGFSNNTCTST